MKTFFLTCLLGFWTISITSVSEAATQFSSADYDVYYFDANDDGVFDYVLSSKDSVVLVRSPLNLVFPRDVKGDFVIDGIDGSVFEHSLSIEEKRHLVVVDYDFHSGDFNGDGVRDWALKATNEIYNSFIIFGSSDSKTPKTARFIDQLSNQALTNARFSIVDVNHDGRDELKVDQGGESIYIDASPVGFSLSSEPFSLSGSQAPVNAPVLPGATIVESSVSSAGTLQLSLPLTLPAGSGGLTPSLSLNYSSSGANSVVGLGWSIDGMSSIHCSGSMIPDTNVGGKITTINEVSDDQKATFFFS